MAGVAPSAACIGTPTIRERVSSRMTIDAEDRRRKRFSPKGLNTSSMLTTFHGLFKSQC